ncbi:hypothetical protein PMAYCL1PPCAC_27507, partial [Pristionchus mayeri]
QAGRFEPGHALSGLTQCTPLIYSGTRSVSQIRTRAAIAIPRAILLLLDHAMVRDRRGDERRKGRVHHLEWRKEVRVRGGWEERFNFVESM